MSDQIKAWLSFASEDLRVAEWTFSQGIYNQTCFHAQQCVEKAIKGLLTEQAIIPPKIHTLKDLLSLLALNPFQFLELQIQLLDRFYIPTRYPDAIPGQLPDRLPNEADAKDALETARQVMKIVESTTIDHKNDLPSDKDENIEIS